MTRSGKLLNLKMKGIRSLPQTTHLRDREEIRDRIGVMMRQEGSTYKCRDYIRRRQVKCFDNSSVLICDQVKGLCYLDHQDDHMVAPSSVDTSCREKMCEWSYRIIDHFHADREIVAISFSYLDRFLDSCKCDKMTFKLAAMTTLYIATKIYNAREIPMSALAELSRGEYEPKHIAEMERKILLTLSWHVHPPTTQCVMSHLYTIFPNSQPSVKRTVFQRASFFAELSVFHYSFVTRPISAIAIAALLNSMEGLDRSQGSSELQAEFLERVELETDLKYDLHNIEALRDELWEVYGSSQQYKYDAMPFTTPQRSPTPSVIEKSDENLGDSPVCVSYMDRYAA
jgi:hypothetical protein